MQFIEDWFKDQMAMYFAPRGYRRPDDVRSFSRHTKWVWVLFVASVIATIGIPWSEANSLSAGPWRLKLFIESGKIVAYGVPSVNSAPPGKVLHLRSGRTPPRDLPSIGRAGVAVSIGGTWRADLWYASFPVWLFATLLWLTWLGVLVWRWPWGFCRRCGYNLRPVSPVRPCPECGGVGTRS